jgi:hypothetical protein
VAESQGLRTLWPDEFRGTLAAEEMGFHSDQFATMDELPPPPAGKEPPPPTVDLGQYNTLVTEKNLPKERLLHLEEFIKQTAASQKQTKMTVPQLKEKAAGNFGGFFDAFEKWEAVEHPPNNKTEETPPAGPTAEELAAAANAGVVNDPTIHEPPPTTGDDAPWPPAQEPVIIQFTERVQKLWHEIIGKGIPLSELKVEDKVIQRMNDFTPENIDQIQKLVDEYKAPRGKK